MNKNIKDIIDKQISMQTKTPDKSDLVDYSALFEYTDDDLSVTPHDTCSVIKERLQQIAGFFANFKYPNLKFIMHLHDHAGDSQDHTNYGICLGKKRHQHFITMPNLYLLNNRVKSVIEEVKTKDIDLFDKMFGSIFAGGANCGKDGARIRYLLSHPNPSLHNICVSNTSVIPIEYQLKYMFNITIDGHSACYDRLYWQMSSNSVPVYIDRDKDIFQLHDELIRPDEHYIESTVEKWPDLFNSMKKGYDDFQMAGDVVSYIKNIVSNGKSFVAEHFGDDATSKSVEIVQYILSELRSKQS